jgi:hypothetical protein
MKNYSFSNITGDESYVARKQADRSGYGRQTDIKPSDANQRI